MIVSPQSGAIGFGSAAGSRSHRGARFGDRSFGVEIAIPSDGFNHRRLLTALGFLTTGEPASFCIATALLAANNLFYRPLSLSFCEFAAFGRVLNDSFSSHSDHSFELCFKQRSVGLNGGKIYPFAVRWISGKTNAVAMDSDDPAPPTDKGCYPRLFGLVMVSTTAVSFRRSAS